MVTYVSEPGQGIPGPWVPHCSLMPFKLANFITGRRPEQSSSPFCLAWTQTFERMIWAFFFFLFLDNTGEIIQVCAYSTTVEHGRHSVIFVLHPLVTLGRRGICSLSLETWKEPLNPEPSIYTHLRNRPIGQKHWVIKLGLDLWDRISKQTESWIVYYFGHRSWRVVKWIFKIILSYMLEIEHCQLLGFLTLLQIEK